MFKMNDIPASQPASQPAQNSCQLPQQPLIQHIANERNLQRAYTWLQAHSPVALPQWDTLKPQLQSQLLRGEYCFQLVTLVRTTNRLSEPETQEIWQPQDQLVLKAISLVLTDHLQADFPRGCYHLEGRAGIKKAVRQIRDYVQTHPQSWVLKTDVQGYYTQIDHLILHQQLCALLPQENYLHRLIWQYLKRAVFEDGNYYDIERGLSLGNPLSPLMAALYLKPLDDLFEGTTSNSPPYQGGVGGGLFYTRFLDEWVVMAPTRWQLQDAMTQSHLLLEQLQLSQAPDKTFIERASHGFDFLGYHLTPEQLTVSKTALQHRDAHLHQLYFPRPLGESRGEGKEVSRWQQYLPRPLGDGRGEGKTAEFNPPPRPRMPNKRPFEAQFLALGAASLLSVAASDSHATIWYVDLTSVTPPVDLIGFGGDLDCDGAVDVQGFGESSGSTRVLLKAYGGGKVYHGTSYNVCVSNTSSAVAGGTECLAGAVQTTGNHWAYSQSGPSWLMFKSTAGYYGWLRVEVDASLPSGGMVTGWYYDDTGAILVGQLPTAANTPDGCPVTPPPTSPTNLTATAVSPTQINLSWTDNSSDETGFKIFRGGVELTPTPKVGANATSTATFSDTGLTCNTTYNYEVKAMNTVGDSSPVTVSGTTAACSAATYGVKVETGGTGSGTVSGNGSFAAGATVTLTATPDKGSTFAGWSPSPCAESFTMPANDLTCTAQFGTASPPTPSTPPLPNQMALFIQVDGTGSGSVSTDTGLYCTREDCPTNPQGEVVCNTAACRDIIDTGAKVILTPQADSGSVFTSWGGHEDCADGEITNFGRLCIAFFQKIYDLSIVITGQGKVVGSDSQGIDCGEGATSCSQSLSHGTTTYLQATPATGMNFLGWGGDCEGLRNPLAVKVVKEMKCEAQFGTVELPPVVVIPEPLVPAEASTPTAEASTPTGEVSTPVGTLVPAEASTPTGEVSTPVGTLVPAEASTPVGTLVPAEASTPVGTLVPAEASTPVGTLVPAEASIPVAEASTPVVPVIPIAALILGGASSSCETTGSINQVCNYGGRPVTELDIQGQGMVSNGVLSNTLVNIGWVSNFTITVKGKLTGGVVTGYIKNFGVMLNFDFKGMSIIGGTLGGVITNTSKVGGFFQDVTLLAGTKITGGTLKGTIKGDKKSPAVLEKVRIKKGSKLSGVKLGKEVKLEKGVVVE